MHNIYNIQCVSDTPTLMIEEEEEKEEEDLLPMTKIIKKEYNINM